MRYGEQLVCKIEPHNKNVKEIENENTQKWSIRIYSFADFQIFWLIVILNRSYVKQNTKK